MQPRRQRRARLVAGLGPEEHATQREFVYSHQWKPHDLVMWDNRTTMHRARRFDRTEVRDVRRTTLAGDAGTIEQAA